MLMLRISSVGLWWICVVFCGLAGCVDEAEDTDVQGLSLDAEPEVLDGLNWPDTTPTDVVRADPETTVGEVSPSFDGRMSDVGSDGELVGADLGEPCEENGDCVSGVCVQIDGGPVCSAACGKGCPVGWGRRARPPPRSRGDGAACRRGTAPPPPHPLSMGCIIIGFATFLRPGPRPGEEAGGN